MKQQLKICYMLKHFNQRFHLVGLGYHETNDMWAYLLYGFEPNIRWLKDMLLHPYGMNSRQDAIKVQSILPACSYGSKNDIDVWRSLSDEQRAGILVKHGLLPSEDEMLLLMLS